jgi:hypothetical protein
MTYEEMMMMYMGNLAGAGQGFTQGILNPYLKGGKKVEPPKLNVQGPTGMQKGYFDFVSQGMKNMPDYMGQGADYLKGAGEQANAAVDLAKSTTGAYDPSSYKSYMDPYQKEVIDQYTKSMQEEFAKTGQQRAASALSAGAFGGGREGVLEAEAQKGFSGELGKGIAGLLSSGYQTAQDRAMKEYADRMGRTLDASKIGLGGAGALTDIGGTYGQYGAIAPEAFQTYADVYGKAGATQYDIAQAKNQAAYDQAMLKYRLPFEAFNLQSGILSGFPSPNYGGSSGGINPFLSMFS